MLEQVFGPLAGEMIKQYGPLGGCVVLLLVLVAQEATKRKTAEKYAADLLALSTKHIERVKELRDKIDVIQEKRIVDGQESLKGLLGTSAALASLTEYIKGRRVGR